METKLGKIETVSFGICGYQGACLGISVTLRGESWAVSASKTAWDANRVKWSNDHSWTEADRSRQYDEIMRYVSDLLRAAKVEDVSALEGKPIEATFDGVELKSWRILTEVL